jgi:protein Mpv17
MSTLLRIAVLLWISSVSAATAFVPRMPSQSSSFPSHSSSLNTFNLCTKHGNSIIKKIPRGGQQEDNWGEAALDDSSDTAPTETTTTNIPTDTIKLSTTAASVSTFSKIASVFATVGKTYSQSLEAHPILTKSCTAGLIFGLSDYLAQMIENSGETKANKSFDWTRLVSTTLVGLLYFGPAAHYWYEWIFRLLPGTGLASTLYKAFWGQILFGPSFTCIFFATNLIQSGDFSLKTWWNKIRNDLPGAWLAGVGYWPIVDLISYSIIPVKLIPLFVNMASLIWTVYLSLVANKGKGK